MPSCIPVAIALPILALGITLAVLIERRRGRAGRRQKEAGLLGFSKLDHLTATITQSRDLRQTLELTLDGTLEAVGMKRGLILIDLPGAGGPGCTITRGFSEGATARLAHGSLRQYLHQSSGRWGHLMVFPLVGDPRIFSSWQLESSFREFQAFFAGNGCKALAVVALGGREKPCGVMLLADSESRSFDAGELRLLESIREQVAMALDNRFLEEAAARRNEEMESLHRIGEALAATFDPQKQFEILRRELKSLFGVSNLWLAVQDVPEGRLELTASFDAPAGSGEQGEPQVRGLVDYVLRTQAPLMIGSDFERTARRLGVASPDPRIRFWCGVPLHFSDGSMGVLAVADFSREEALDGPQFQLLEVLANEVRVSIENARLYQREQRRARHLALLNEITRKATAMLDPQELRFNVCEQIRSTFGYDLVRFEALDAERQELVIEAQEGYAPEVVGRRSAIGVGLPGVAAETGEPARANFVGRDKRYLALDARVQSSLSLPLKYGAEVVGVLVVESFRENAFSNQDALMLRTLADQLAIALHNASAFQSAQEQAITDNLTRLKTHRFFMEALGAEWRRAPRSGRPFSVVMLDLDGFKRVNDRYGHVEGDRVLVAVARLLDSRSRHVNPVARYGGDEFSILMPEAELGQAEILAERLRSGLASDPYLASHAVTGSFGIANFPAHGATADEILRVADCGMFLAKHEGGNCVRIASRVALPEGTELEQKVLDAYLGVAVKRFFSTGPEAFEQYMTRFEQAVKGGPGSSNSLMDTVTALAFAIDAKDHYTQGHSQSVSRLAVQIARQVGLPDSEIEEVRLAGILHDIGKIGVPEHLLNKPARLTEDEYEIVKSHAVLGEKILGPLKGKGMGRIRKMVRSHHECFNGSGYPDGLRGEEIPLGARILTVADCFDTMVSRRTYKEGRSVDDAMGELRRVSGVHFDRALVEAFIQSFAASQAHSQLSAAMQRPAN